VLGLTHAMAVSLGPEVRVNSISPGSIDARSRHSAPESAHKLHPTGPHGVPLHIAKLAWFLVHDDNGFITGQDIVVDGGLSKKLDPAVSNNRAFFLD